MSNEIENVHFYVEVPRVVEAIQFNRGTYADCVKFTNGRLKNMITPRCIDGISTADLIQDMMRPDDHTRIEEGWYIIKLKAIDSFLAMPGSEFNKKYNLVAE